MPLLSVITCMLKLIPCLFVCFVRHFPCVNKSRNLYSLFLKLVAPNYEVWYFGAKSTILWEPKIFSSHLHSIIDKACATASSWDVLYPTHKHCTSTYTFKQYFRHASLTWFVFPNIWPCDCHNLLIILWYVSCHPWTDLLPSDLNGNSTPKSMVWNQYVRQRQLSYVASIEESFLLNMYRSQPNELLFWMAIEVVKCGLHTSATQLWIAERKSLIFHCLSNL